MTKQTKKMAAPPLSARRVEVTCAPSRGRQGGGVGPTLDLDARRQGVHVRSRHAYIVYHPLTSAHLRRAACSLGGVISVCATPLAASTVTDMAQAGAAVIRPSHDQALTAEIVATSVSCLTDAIECLARLLDDPDLIARIRIDEAACIAELDSESRPVYPRRLN